MNLLDDPWIPIRRRSGAREKIRPADVTSRYVEDPVVDLASPRPDFDGALAQFLIGIVQTRFAPENPREWRRSFDHPPTPDTLHAAWSADANAFWLDGERRRFGQEFELARSDAKTLGIATLLPEFPGAQSEKFNTDHFVKRQHDAALCSDCAAAALFAAQTNSPAGGRGYRTGLRGGGPLTTLVLGRTLWSSTWLNVLETGGFVDGEQRYGDPELSSVSDFFPWMAPLRTSENDAKNTQSTYPQHIHPAQVFWSTPRRIWLEFNGSPGACAVCGDTVETMVGRVRSRSNGVNYWDQFPHPLSPYRTQKDRSRTPVKGSPRGLSYRDWIGHIFRSQDAGREPAHVVKAYLASASRCRRSGHRLWTFGFDMDNAKARAWIESRMPVILPDDGNDAEQSTSRHQAYADLITKLVESSAYCQVMSAKFTKEAMARRPGDLKGDTSFLDRRFIEFTTEPFHVAQTRLVEDLDSDERRVEVMRVWWTAIRRAATSVFEEHVRPEAIDVQDAGRVARAWNSLNKVLWGKRLRALLGIPAAPATPVHKSGEGSR